MWPDRVSNQGPLALESDLLPTALHGPSKFYEKLLSFIQTFKFNQQCFNILAHVKCLKVTLPSLKLAESIA